MDPQQELFTGLLLALKAHFEPKGVKVYDGELPPDGTPYPFIYLAGTRQNDRSTKSQKIGVVNQHIDFWHNNPRQRGTVSQLMLEAKQICWEFKQTANFGWFAADDMNQNILSDGTTGKPLMHGYLSVNFNFS